MCLTCVWGGIHIPIKIRNVKALKASSPSCLYVYAFMTTLLWFLYMQQGIWSNQNHVNHKHFAHSLQSCTLPLRVFSRVRAWFPVQLSCSTEKTSQGVGVFLTNGHVPREIQTVRNHACPVPMPNHILLLTYLVLFWLQKKA